MKNLYDIVIKKHVVLLILVAGLLRLGYIVTLEDRSYFFDTVHYDQAACAILEDGTFGSSFHYYDEYKHYCLEPIYPLFLAGIYALFGRSFLIVRIIQVLLSLVQLNFIYRIVKMLRPRAAWLALVFGAIYPFFIYLPGLLYVTQLFSLLLILAIYFFLRYAVDFRQKWLIPFALSLGVAIVAVPIALPGFILFVAWMVFFARVKQKKWTHIVTAATVIILILTPWTVRNWQVFHILSPGRACLAERRVFELVDLQFRFADSEKLTRFPADQFKVNVIRTADAPLFECFVDEKLIAVLKVNEPFTWHDSSYYGIIFKGGGDMHVQRLQFAQNDTFFLDSTNDREWLHAEQVTIGEEAIELHGASGKWEYAAVFPTPGSAQSFIMSYPSTIKPADVSRAAILFNLQCPRLDADGYMIWLHPWMQADLWKIENGRPAQSVQTIDLFIKENPVNLRALIAQNPVRFLFQHVGPEFLNFWSPAVKRITTSAQLSRAMNAASWLFFTPLLLFAVIGIFTLRDQWKSLLILLIPIVTISLSYSIFFAEVRYRIPVDGFLIVLGAIGLDGVMRRWRRRRYL
ncbi:glycosyltransferase family 39 protein [candidate division KSB1 bacterium]|nr:glycosyltransferase family 39 protein [candidate division KSB1 bacterium]